MKEELKSKIVFAVVIVAIVGAVFYAGMSYGKNQIASQLLVEGVTNKALGQPEEVDFSLFWDTWRLIEEEFVDRSDIDKQEMVYGAIAGMVDALGDPYTIFLKPPEAKVFKEDVSGSFEGIGAEIGIRKDVLTIISPLKGSPAETAGIKAGDKVIEVDGESTFDLTLNEAVQLIRGPGGTDVVLTVVRDDGEPQEISITRDTIKVPVVEWEIKDGGIVHVELFSFSNEATKAFREALLEILRNPVDKVVLDLRNNPGGYLEVAQELMGWFVDPGEVVAIEDFGDGRQQREYRAIGNGALKNFDVVVLINQGSASASEIMAGALRDIRGVQLVGTKSFGKGSIQELKNLKGGSSVKVTIAKWLTPSGISISEEGLEPDFEVEITSEDEEAEVDPQLDKALEILRGN